MLRTNAGDQIIAEDLTTARDYQSIEGHPAASRSLSFQQYLAILRHKVGTLADLLLENIVVFLGLGAVGLISWEMYKARGFSPYVVSLRSNATAVIDVTCPTPGDPFIEDIFSIIPGLAAQARAALINMGDCPDDYSSVNANDLIFDKPNTLASCWYPIARGITDILWNMAGNMTCYINNQANITQSIQQDDADFYFYQRNLDLSAWRPVGAIVAIMAIAFLMRYLTSRYVTRTLIKAKDYAIELAGSLLSHVLSGITNKLLNKIVYVVNVIRHACGKISDIAYIPANWPKYIFKATDMALWVGPLQTHALTICKVPLLVVGLQTLLNRLDRAAPGTRQVVENVLQDLDESAEKGQLNEGDAIRALSTRLTAENATFNDLYPVNEEMKSIAESMQTLDVLLFKTHFKNDIRNATNPELLKRDIQQNLNVLRNPLYQYLNDKELKRVSNKILLWLPTPADGDYDAILKQRLDILRAIICDTKNKKAAIQTLAYHLDRWQLTIRFYYFLHRTIHPNYMGTLIDSCKQLDKSAEQETIVRLGYLYFDSSARAADANLESTGRLTTSLTATRV